MAELGAAIGASAALGGAVYASATGFVARHETTHSLQVTEIRHLVTDFEAAYRRGEVIEDDWQRYQTIRDEARKKESEYEESIEAYKETPLYHFVTKWKRKRQVRKEKKALRRVNASLRSHYYESTSEASDTSSITAASGSPPRSRLIHSDEDDGRILSWAENVANSGSDDRKEKQRREQMRREELRDGYAKLRGVLPVRDRKVREAGRLTLLHCATQHILTLEKVHQDLESRIVQMETELLLYSRHEPHKPG